MNMLKSIATSEYFYLDNQNKIDLDGDDINFGYVERLNATKVIKKFLV